MEGYLVFVGMRLAMVLGAALLVYWQVSSRRVGTEWAQGGHRVDTEWAHAVHMQYVHRRAEA